MAIPTEEVTKLREMYDKVEAEMVLDAETPFYTPDQATAIKSELRARAMGWALLEVVEGLTHMANARPLGNYGDHRAVEITISESQLDRMNEVLKLAKAVR